MVMWMKHMKEKQCTASLHTSTAAALTSNTGSKAAFFCAALGEASDSGFPDGLEFGLCLFFAEATTVILCSMHDLEGVLARAMLQNEAEELDKRRLCMSSGSELKTMHANDPSPPKHIPN